MPTTGSTSRPRNVDAIAFLESDHAATRELLAMFMRRPLVGRGRERAIHVLTEDLWIHMQLEEDVFYPVLASLDRGMPAVPAARHSLRAALSALERSWDDDAEMLRLMRRIFALHEHDTLHEEIAVFPRARRVIGARVLGELGAELDARRQDLRESGMARGHGCARVCLAVPPTATSPEADRPMLPK